MLRFISTLTIIDVHAFIQHIEMFCTVR